MNVKELPVHVFDELIHVGTMNPDDKQDFSYEGHGLSVSHDPDEWRSIARLGGEDHVITAKGGIKLLLAHDLTSEDRNEIIKWAFDNGLVENFSGYNVLWEDCETEEEVSMFVKTEAEAIEEAEFVEGKYEKTSILRQTDKMIKMMNGMSSEYDAFDFLLPLYVEHVLNNFHGVWWEDIYGEWSAPRGVIVPSKLPEINVTAA